MNFEVQSWLLRFDIRYSKFCSSDLLLTIRTWEKAYVRICQTSTTSPEEPRDLSLEVRSLSLYPKKITAPESISAEF
jgi:hypothetical protein